MCIHPNCTKYASYNIEGINKALYCSLHKQEGMIDVKSKRCTYDGCKTSPSYNIEGQSRAFCYIHKREGMINVLIGNHKCIYTDCIKYASHNIEGNRKAIYCSLHKEENMVNVRYNNQLCIHPDCKKLSSYNVEGNRKSLYCSLHKEEGMIDVKSKRCMYDGCKTSPSYNIEGKISAFCFIHKQDGMINVKNIHKKCIHPGCNNNYPSYNVEGCNKAIYCSLHKKEGMINIKTKKCIYTDCKKCALYNLEGEISAFCSIHKKDGMIIVKNINQRCIHPGCVKRSSYNVEGIHKALYCLNHKKDNMIDVRHKTCKSEWCFTRINNYKYKGYCVFCYINIFPDESVSHNYKNKEYAVVEYIKTTFPNFTIITDKIIKTGCSKRRPDILLDLGYQIIIIEVDENQHIVYDCSCENKRIMELSQDVGHRPIVFIRFNPDDYKNKSMNVSSCWGINNNGICVIKSNKKKEWIERLLVLSNEIRYWTNPLNVTNKTIEIIQLFYDIYV